MELNKYERISLKRVNIWERKSQGKFIDISSKPVDYLIKKIGTDKFKRFESAIENTLNKMVNTATYSVNEKELLKRAHDHGIMINDLSELKTCNLKLVDFCNRKHIKFHQRAGAAQGAVAGIGGALAATADLTAILLQVFHLVQEIAFCYGYDPNDAIEKIILLRIIEAGIGNSANKRHALAEIQKLIQIEQDDKDSEISQKAISVFGGHAMSEYVENLSVALLVRLFPRSLPLPLITMAISARSDHEIMESTGETAFMVFRKRFIERKLTL